MIVPMMLTLCTIAGQFLFVASTPPNLQLKNVEGRDMIKNQVGTDINPGTVYNSNERYANVQLHTIHIFNHPNQLASYKSQLKPDTI